MQICDSETALLATFLLDSSILAAGRDTLTPRDFSNPQNAVLYGSLLDAIELGVIPCNGTSEPVDLVAFYGHLNDVGRMAAIGGPERIAQLVESIYTTIDFQYHLDRTRSASILRQLNEISDPESGLDQQTKIAKIADLNARLLDLREGRLTPLHNHETSATEFVTNTPPPLDYILQDFLPRNIVGGIIAQGGVGKSYLFTLFAVCFATGETVGSFRPARPTNVLCIFAEDSRDEVHRRTYHTVRHLLPVITEATHNLLNKNLHVVSMLGKILPLLELRNGNAVKAPGFTWLEKTISSHPGLEVLILDPKSRIYGLEENSNEHNTAFVASLEELSMRFGLTILFSHHAAKAAAGTLSQHAARGGSALVDACRWVANMRPLDDEAAAKFDVNPRQYIEFDVTKNNYAEATPQSLFFKRGQHGILEPANLWNDRFKQLAAVLTETLLDHAYLSRRDLVFGAKGKEVRDRLKETAKVSRADLEGVIDFCLREGTLEIASIKGERGQERNVLKVRFAA